MEWFVDNDVVVVVVGELLWVPCEECSGVHGVDLLGGVVWVGVCVLFVGDGDVGGDDFVFVWVDDGGVLESGDGGGDVPVVVVVVPVAVSD